MTQQNEENIQRWVEDVREYIFFIIFILRNQELNCVIAETGCFWGMLTNMGRKGYKRTKVTEMFRIRFSMYVLTIHCKSNTYKLYFNWKLYLN